MTATSAAVTEEDSELDHLATLSAELTTQFQSGASLQPDLAQVGRLLAVTSGDLHSVQSKAWFRKAWLIVTGERGRLRDVTAQNLIQVQIVVLKSLATLMREGTHQAERLVLLTKHIGRIRADHNELASLLLQFNTKHQAQYARLACHVRSQHRLLRTAMIVLAGSLLVTAMALLVPGIRRPESYPWFALAAAIPGAALLAQLGIEPLQLRRAPSGPLRVTGKYQQQPTSNLTHTGEAFLELAQQPPPAPPPVFQIRPDGEDLASLTNLTLDETSLLLSLEYHLARSDVNATADPNLRTRKHRWLNRWIEAAAAGGKIVIVRDPKDMRRGLRELQGLPNARFRLRTILFELFLFAPYFPFAGPAPALGSFQKPTTDAGITADEQVLDRELTEWSRKLGDDPTILHGAKKAYRAALNAIPPPSMPLVLKITIAVLTTIIVAITAGAAAPLIGGLVGATFLGLSGAAATSAGLALLGGGAVAAGGLGMAGGTIVVIAGGAALGAGFALTAGAATQPLSQLLATDSTLALSQLARIEGLVRVVLRDHPDSRELLDQAIDLELKSQEALEQIADRATDETARRTARDAFDLYRRAIERLKEHRAALG